MHEKELRLALVCYGGVSLAIYMSGVTSEVLKVVRASRAYHSVIDPDERRDKTMTMLLIPQPMKLTRSGSTSNSCNLLLRNLSCGLSLTLFPGLRRAGSTVFYLLGRWPMTSLLTAIARCGSSAPT